jgi:hypothetical protein
MPPVRALLLLVSVSALVAGCGSSGGSPSSTTARRARSVTTAPTGAPTSTASGPPPMSMETLRTTARDFITLDKQAVDLIRSGHRGELRRRLLVVRRQLTRLSDHPPTSAQDAAAVLGTGREVATALLDVIAKPSKDNLTIYVTTSWRTTRCWGS